MRLLHESLIEVIEMLAGAAGDKEVLDKISERFVLFPQLDVYITLALSPETAAVFNEYFILTTCVVKDPESITALDPSVPTKDHCQPLAIPVNAGAVYLYILPPHESLINVIVILDGAVGGVKARLLKMDVLKRLLPHPDVYESLTLSPTAAALLEVYFILIIFDVKDPESIEAVLYKLPTNDHCHPVAPTVKAGAV